MSSMEKWSRQSCLLAKDIGSIATIAEQLTQLQQNISFVTRFVLMFKKACWANFMGLSMCDITPYTSRNC
jgi:hypothetical protein